MGTTGGIKGLLEREVIFKRLDPKDPAPQLQGFGYGAAMAGYRASKKQAGSSPAAAQPKAAPTKARPGRRVRTGLGSSAKTAERTLLGN